MVEAQVYINTLQGRLLQLSNEDSETTIAALVDQRRQILDAYKDYTKEFTNMSAIGLMKLSIKRLFQRGKNG